MNPSDNNTIQWQMVKVSIEMKESLEASWLQAEQKEEKKTRM